ncbi:MAG: chemotaxis protein CheX [Lachnospiraceae bacterium]|nr:chemotaxis protein CheX [Lachnospiraceae bacterium]
MVEYILGNYLVETKKISATQLQTVLHKQDSVRVKLGLIAVSEGFMTTEQAEEVNEIQAIRDMRFGDIAVEKGYLTDEQVGKLLKEQGNTYLMFIQTLVDENLLQMSEVDGILEEFRKQHDFTNTEMEDIKRDDVDRIVPLYLPEEAQKFSELVGVAVRTLIRLIDRRIYVGPATISNCIEGEAMVCQQLEGKGGFVDCLAEDTGALLKVGSIFGQEDFMELDADVLDAAGELLNCINGLYASNKSHEGIDLELLPPTYIQGGSQQPKDLVCNVPVYINGKKLYFIVAEPV